MTDPDERDALVTLGHLVEPGNRDLGDLVDECGAVESLRRLVAGAVTDRLRASVAPRLQAVDLDRLAERAHERAQRLGVAILVPGDAGWPAQLGALRAISEDVRDPIRRDTYPPLCLWTRGAATLAPACLRAVSVVGSRASTDYGDHVATELGFGLAEKGFTVISGGAFGIDAAVHRGALAGGGLTMAVLACGVDRPYPASHGGLFEAITQTGLVISEWPPGSDPHRLRFLIRNRVIAALSQGTVLVEANFRSGARFTLNRARDLARVLMVVPGAVTSAMSAGCHDELRRPDTILVAGVAHVVDAVGRLGVDAAPTQRGPDAPRDQLTQLQQQIIDGVRPRKVLSAEKIAAAVGASVRDARRTLPILATSGFVLAVDGGYRLPRKSEHGERGQPRLL